MGGVQNSQKRRRNYGPASGHPRVHKPVAVGAGSSPQGSGRAQSSRSPRSRPPGYPGGAGPRGTGGQGRRGGVPGAEGLQSPAEAGAAMAAAGAARARVGREKKEPALGGPRLGSRLWASCASSRRPRQG